MGYLGMGGISTGTLFSLHFIGGGDLDHYYLKGNRLQRVDIKNGEPSRGNKLGESKSNNKSKKRGSDLLN